MGVLLLRGDAGRNLRIQYSILTELVQSEKMEQLLIVLFPEKGRPRMVCLIWLLKLSENPQNDLKVIHNLLFISTPYFIWIGRFSALSIKLHFIVTFIYHSIKLTIMGISEYSNKKPRSTNKVICCVV